MRKIGFFSRRNAGYLLFGILVIALLAVLLWWEKEVNSAGADPLETHYSYPSGEYDQPISLKISSAHPDAEIYFTLDGRMPDPNQGHLYSQPLQLSADLGQVVVVRSAAYLPDGTTGPINHAAFFMGLDTELPKLSLIADPDDLWGAEDGIYVNHDQRGREWERPVDLTFITADGETGFNLGAGLRIHGEWTRQFSDKKSMRLYFRDEYGPTKLNYPMFGPNGQIAFDKLILHNSDKDLNLFKNQLTDQLAKEIGVFSSQNQPVLLFINGQPWGIYNIREPIDQRFLAENFDIPEAVISDTPNNLVKQIGEQKADELQHWEHFIQFALENDLSNPVNFSYLQTQIDLDNFIDYYLLEMYVANTDWPHHNMHQFRPETQGGRWEWIVWDNNETFERVDRQMVQHILDTQHPLGERMETFIQRLLQNQDFRNRFLTRAADLLNSTLSPDSVRPRMESLAGQFDQDIEFERNRWDISTSSEDVLEQMVTYVENRPDIMRQHFIDSLGLSGTAVLTIHQASEMPAWIVVNDTEPQELPWSGIYFQETEIKLQAIAPDGYAFVSWEGLPEPGSADENPLTLQIKGDTTLTPNFSQLPSGTPRKGDVTIESYQIDDRGEIEGDWFDLRVNKNGGVDLRGWRLTDNDQIGASDEGSIILRDDPLFANLAAGTRIRVVATKSRFNSERFSEDGWRNGILTLYVGNHFLDTETDPWFNLGPRDNLLLLAPGADAGWEDDIPIDLWSTNRAVRRASFGFSPRPDD